MGDYIGDYLVIGVTKGDTRSLEPGSYGLFRGTFLGVLQQAIPVVPLLLLHTTPYISLHIPS